ncbi:MAG: hypothetical protein H7246_07130 [Phycisphaerae bacterium]|nr:hypothetical protein [Saprospiraceae bacterium]
MKRNFIRLKCLTAWLLFLSSTINSTPLLHTFTGNPDHGVSKQPTSQAPCELVCSGDLSFTLGPGECAVVVTYDVHTTGDCLPSMVVQTSGLPSGSAFPVGITHNCFSIDLPPLGLPDGDTTCCFDVIVNPLPNPNALLTCNDLTFISLDEDCQHCIGAEDILEGGPYGCFNDYLVELDKTVPFGNGPWVSGCVGASDIGKTYQIRITEPVFGNKCWGNVKMEDKQAPILDCPSAQLPCNFPSFAPEYVQTATFTLKFAADSLPRSLDSGQYFIFNIPVGVGAVVNDVDCRVKINNANAWNVQIEVISPAGTSALIWDALGGCGLIDPIFARFDDEGLASNQCADLGADLHLDVMSALGFDSLGVFDGENAEGIWQIKISNPDLQGFGYVAEVEIAELYINMTGQFSAGFPNGLSGNCVQAIGNNQYLVPAGCGDPQLDNCSAVTLSYLDTTIPDDCASGLTAHINRTWTARDASGNITTCIQRIDQARPGLTDVMVPPNYDGIDAPALTCSGGNFASPEWISSQGLQGEPLLFGLSEGCSINWAYIDVVTKVCDGTYKIRRDWTIIDWCIGEMILHNQTIKVVDDQGPTLACPQNFTVSTDPFTCCATVNLPDVILADGCSRIKAISGTVTLFDPNTGLQTGTEAFGGSLATFPGNNLSNPDTLGAYGSTPCLPLGAQIVQYMAEDDCGNTATCTFQLRIYDYVPPVAICDETITVAIGLDDSSDCLGPEGPGGSPAALDACHFGGVTWVKASAFDDGSYDVCGSVKLTIRRTAPYSDCILGLNATNGKTPCNDAFPDVPSEFERAISEYDSIKFYSCEVGTVQPVILRVYQLETNGNFSIGPDGAPIFNECIIQVTVEDKIKPLCTPPPKTTLSCEQFQPNLLLYGNATLNDNSCLDDSKIYGSQCGLTHTVNYSNFDSLCNKGTILRTFHAFDCHGNSSQCTQQIVVNYNQDYFIRFPNDMLVTTCDGTNNYGEPTFFGEDCELLGKSYEDQVFLDVPDACFKIERKWTVINWCTFNPILSPTIVPNPNPNPIVNHPSNLPGPIVSACGTLPPWNPTIVKINPLDTAATSYCTFWSANANGYEYTQRIKIIDVHDPEIANCPTSPVVVGDTTLNDPALWHNVFNPNLPVQDLAEAKTDLTITSADDCSGGNLPEVEFLLFLDLDNDGIMESVVNSESLSGADTIRYNNLNTPGYLGGAPVTFDSRPVPTNQKWHFTLRQSNDPDQTITALRWNTAVAPNTFVIPELPTGTHKIKWSVIDKCGNLAVCEHTFTIQQGPSTGIETIENDGFALFQNEPNPFSQTTSIGFHLPNAAEARLSVYDAEGRLLWGKTDSFKEGYNAVQLEGNLLHASAVLYYKLESGTHVAWRKMVVVR